MIEFEDIEDIEEWLAPMDYAAFWKAVAPWNLTLQDRAHCDGLISRGEVQRSLILRVLKSMARRELTEMLGVGRRAYHPIDAESLASIH